MLKTVIAAVCISSASALVVSAATAAPHRDAVSVAYDQGQLTVTVTARSSLRVVLDGLCARTASKCEVAEAVALTPVPPSTYRGSWEQVVAEILGQSGLAYAAVRPGPGRTGELVVTGERAAAAAPALSTPPGMESPPSETAEAEGPVEDTPAAEAASAAAPEPVAPIVVPPGSSLVATPFEGPQGAPLNVVVGPRDENAPAIAVLPFSDEFGTPLEVPLDDTPPQVLPFTGPDGELIRAPDVIPGQKLDDPFRTPRATR